MNMVTTAKAQMVLSADRQRISTTIITNAQQPRDEETEHTALEFLFKARVKKTLELELKVHLWIIFSSFKYHQK